MKLAIGKQHIPLLATMVVFVLLYATASMMYDSFFSLRATTNLLADNAFLGIVAIGMTFVILSGGIDLSVGSVLAFSTILIATLIGEYNVHPLTAMAAALVVGSAFGMLMGFLIHRYKLPAFLVTLGGMFFARGMAFVIRMESLDISHPFYDLVLDDVRIGLPAKAQLPATALIFLLVLAAAIYLAHLTRFGRNVYAVGGSEYSAMVMGLPVAWTKVLVYTMSGFCSALGGVVFTFYTGSGNPSATVGLELDAIASVVIGGTLLSGGKGYVAGTLLGILIYGTIRSALVFDGRLPASWLRISIGVLLLVFILLQRFLSRETETSK
ncbi:galactofuranose ABC transporter, permease protein YjfF [Candidatus Sumerlaeota bacterium]